LSFNKLDAEAAKFLSEGLKANTGLTALNLRYNDLGDDAKKAIQKAAGSKVTVQV